MNLPADVQMMQTKRMDRSGKSVTVRSNSDDQIGWPNSTGHGDQQLGVDQLVVDERVSVTHRRMPVREIITLVCTSPMLREVVEISETAQL